MHAVEQVRHSPGGELPALMPQCKKVGVLQVRPVADGPRISPPPSVYGALGVVFGQQHTVGAAHRRKGSYAACVAAGENSHLANLPLVGCDAGLVAAEDARRLADVDVTARTEHVQHFFGV